MNKRSFTMKVEKEKDVNNEAYILGNDLSTENYGTARIEKDMNAPESTATFDGIINEMLPPEIMERIFQMLDNDDLSNVVSVCRRWRDVGECLWNWDYGGGIDIFEGSELDMLAIKRVEHVEEIRMRMILGDSDWTNDDVKKLFKTIKNLTKLTYFSMPSSDLTALDPSVFVNTLLAINNVNLTGCKMTDEQLNWLFGAINENTKLHTLYLIEVNLSGVNRDILAAGMNKLKKVDLSMAKLDTKQRTAVLSQAGKQTNLVYLRMGMCWVRAASLDEEIVRKAGLNIKNFRVWRE